MTSPQKFAHVRFYKLFYSKKIFTLEILIHILVLIAIINLMHDLWMLIVLTLYLLLTIRFFQTESVRVQFNHHPAISFRKETDCLALSDDEGDKLYKSDEIKIFTTRWFILLQLGRGKSRLNKWLLSDSFQDMTHYTSFRRQLIEKKYAS